MEAQRLAIARGEPSKDIMTVDESLLLLWLQCEILQTNATKSISHSFTKRINAIVIQTITVTRNKFQNSKYYKLVYGNINLLKVLLACTITQILGNCSAHVPCNEHQAIF